MCCRDKHAVLSRHVLQQYVAPPSRESHGHSGRLHRTILLQAVSRSLHFLQPLLIRWYKFRNSRVNEKVFHFRRCCKLSNQTARPRYHNAFLHYNSNLDLHRALFVLILSLLMAAHTH